MNTKLETIQQHDPERNQYCNNLHCVEIVMHILIMGMIYDSSSSSNAFALTTYALFALFQHVIIKWLDIKDKSPFHISMHIIFDIVLSAVALLIPITAQYVAKGYNNAVSSITTEIGSVPNGNATAALHKQSHDALNYLDAVSDFMISTFIKAPFVTGENLILFAIGFYLISRPIALIVTFIRHK
ncbi:hypothetical protein [Aliivibrio fischeri]|uniref:hypothetical protein n=1 Tax=Aliivibrio fischeri TaxID=668 RepID=UPI0007C5732A|nr:hypothetical protein [Aliivibrio fischeri]